MTAYLNFEDEFKTVRRTEILFSQYIMCLFLKKEFNEVTQNKEERLKLMNFDQNKVYYYENKRWPSSEKKMVEKDGHIHVQWYNIVEVKELSFNLKGISKSKSLQIAHELGETIIDRNESENIQSMDESSLGDEFEIINDKRDDGDKSIGKICRSFEKMKKDLVKRKKCGKDDDSDYGIPPLRTENDWPKNGTDYECVEDAQRNVHKTGKKQIFSQIVHGNSTKDKSLLKKKRFYPEEFLSRADGRNDKGGYY